MSVEGFEPSHPFGQHPLKLPRLPFRHTDSLYYIVVKKQNPSSYIRWREGDSCLLL